MARASRACAVAAARKISVQVEAEGPSAMRCPSKRLSKRKREELSEYEDDVEEDVKEETEEEISEELELVIRQTTTKTSKRRTARDDAKIDSAALCKQLFGVGPDHRETPPPACCRPPERRHGVPYHRPLLLDGRVGREGRRALLAWYDGVSAARGMPWRQPWVHPDQQTRAALAARAYQVWISEVMAQQTRIAVVVDYWTRWMARWPTVAALAAAAPADVVAAWRGLGYYSRAARLHAAARALMAEGDGDDGGDQGLLPADARELQARVAGAGRYTAGAVSAIVFGRAAAMVDGNVVRVLSRQMGLYAAPGGEGVSQKTLSDLIWAAAEALVAVVARDDDDDDDDEANAAWPEEAPLSDRPGRWGQALMELGSTVCTPSPNCGACPIQVTCRAYGEGLLQTQGGKELSRQEDDNADLCPLCEAFPEIDIDVDDDNASKQLTKRRKQTSDRQRSAYFDVEDTPEAIAAAALPTIVAHARLFPLRRPKKPIRVVETLVCAVRARAPGGHGGWTYLLQQRPAKGLLAGLWQLPSEDVPETKKTAATRRRAAEAFVGRLWDTNTSLSFIDQLDSVPWLFSHIRQTMHVYLFAVEGGDVLPPAPPSCCWASAAEAEETYTMGTGMRKCWRLVREAA